MILIHALLLANTTLGDTAATERTPAQIVCALTGDCGGRAGGERPRRPREASFDAAGLAERSLEAQFAKVRAARARVAVATR